MSKEEFIEEKEYTILQHREIVDCDFEIQGVKRAMLDIVNNVGAIKKKDMQGGLDITIKAVVSIICGVGGSKKVADVMLEMVEMKVADAFRRKK